MVLQFDGSNWKASRADTGASVPLAGTGTAADPLVINGVTLVVGGTPLPTTDSCCSPPQASPAAWRSPSPIRPGLQPLLR